MATFDYSESAEDILNSCIDMVKTFENLRTFTGKDKIELKISLDYGETINGAITEGSYDPLGLCVDRCSRLNSQVGPNEIAFSSEFNRKLNIKDKTSLHPMIEKVENLKESTKGLGTISYYKVILRHSIYNH